MLLHGLAGYAREWDETASWLSASCRVFATEQRGHGRSERRPADLSRSAFVDDAAAWLRQLDLAPATVVGQSLGGHTAFLLAARHPELVHALVVAEATPEPYLEAQEVVGGWLDSWPVPFASRPDALAFFGGDTLRGRTWSGGLDRRDDGLWPAFDLDVMVAAIAEGAATDRWDEWRRIRCPALIVRAAGPDGRETYERMAAVNSSARLVEIEEAGHDVHLDQPAAWRAAIEPFVVGSDPASAGASLS
jgi:pimeloyl-ACP methyl ester carboxylesterase